MIFLVLHRTNDGYIRLCTRFLVVALLILTYVPVFAAQVTFKPSLALSETYTDNVTLSNSGEEEEDYVTEITPNLALRADGNRLNATLGFTLENLFYLQASDRYARYHNLAIDASAELIKDFAFLNLGVSDDQEGLLSSGGLAQNNRNAVDRADILTGFIKPHFKKRFGGKAEGVASYSYKEIRNDGLGVSNAEIEATQVGLKSGPFFRRMTWSLNYSQETTKRNKARNNRKESSAAKMGYRVYKKLGVLFDAGDERSNFATSRNGSYYAGGIEFVPNSMLRIGLLSGDNLDEASLSWVPSSRSALNILWKDKKVGENPGEVWEGTLRLVNRRVVWRASYFEGITSSAQSLGASASQNTQSQSDDASSSECPLSDADFSFKRKQMNFGYKTAKSLISVALHKERKKFDADLNERSHKGRVSWRWRFASRTTMLLSFQKSNDECSGVGRSQGTEVGFFRKMGRGMEGSVKAQFKSGDGSESYDENSFSAGVKWHF